MSNTYQRFIRHKRTGLTLQTEPKNNSRCYDATEDALKGELLGFIHDLSLIVEAGCQKDANQDANKQINLILDKDTQGTSLLVAISWSNS